MCFLHDDIYKKLVSSTFNWEVIGKKNNIVEKNLTFIQFRNLTRYTCVFLSHLFPIITIFLHHHHQHLRYIVVIES